MEDFRSSRVVVWTKGRNMVFGGYGVKMNFGKR